MTEEQRWKTEMGIENDKVKELHVLNENFRTFIDILRQYRQDSLPKQPARARKEETPDWRSTLVKRD